MKLFPPDRVSTRRVTSKKKIRRFFRQKKNETKLKNVQKHFLSENQLFKEIWTEGSGRFRVFSAQIKRSSFDAFTIKGIKGSERSCVKESQEKFGKNQLLGGDGADVTASIMYYFVVFIVTTQITCSSTNRSQTFFNEPSFGFLRESQINDYSVFFRI